MSILTDLLPASIKRIIWDRKYKNGYGFASVPKEVLLPLMDRRIIAEMGCGYAALLKDLRASGWNGFFIGVDISKAAIGQNIRTYPNRSSWYQLPIEDYRALGGEDAICFIESLYYVPLGKVDEVVRRAHAALVPGGILLFRFHDLAKHRAYVDAIWKIFPEAEMQGHLVIVRKLCQF
jgi:SAM-dependent methyltransferase